MINHPTQYYMAHHFLVRVRVQGKPWRTLPVVRVKGGTSDGYCLDLSGAAGPGDTMLSRLWDVVAGKVFEIELWNGASAVGDNPAVIRRKAYAVMGYDVIPYDFDCMEARVSLETVRLQGLRLLETTVYTLATLDPSVGDDVMGFARRLASTMPSGPGTYVLFFAQLPGNHYPAANKGELRLTVETPEGQPPRYSAEVNVSKVRVDGCYSSELAEMQQEADPDPQFIYEGRDLNDVVSTALYRARLLVGRVIESVLKL